MNNQIQYELKEAFIRGRATGLSEMATDEALRDFDRLFGTITVCPQCERNLTKNKDLCNDCIVKQPCDHEPEMSHSEHSYVYCKLCGESLPEDYISLKDLIEKTHPI